MGKIIRPNHIVFVIKLLSYLDKYFCSSKTARRVKNILINTYTKFAVKFESTRSTSQVLLQIIMVHEVFANLNQGFRKVKSPCEVCCFSKISVTSKYVINLKIRTNKIELSFALYNSATGNGLVRKNTSSRIVGCLRQQKRGCVVCLSF